LEDYFVVYDMKDNIVCYLHNIYDFSDFTGIRIRDINYKFNKSKTNFINIKRNKQLLKIYKFC